MLPQPRSISDPKAASPNIHYHYFLSKAQMFPNRSCLSSRESANYPPPLQESRNNKPKTKKGQRKYERREKRKGVMGLRDLHVTIICKKFPAHSVWSSLYSFNFLQPAWLFDGETSTQTLLSPLTSPVPLQYSLLAGCHWS